MGGSLLLAPLIPVVQVALLVYAGRALAAHQLEGPARSARRRAVATSTITVLAAATFVVLAPYDEIGLATMPALAASAGVVMAALGELTWPRPRGEHREASLTVRCGTGTASLNRLFLVGLASSAVLLILGVVTAGPTGRAVQRAWPGGAASAGPYPGPPYAVPIGLALTVLSLATWWGLCRTDSRPALGPGLEKVDRAIRAGARVRVLRLAATGALLTAAGLAIAMGSSLNGVTQRLRMKWEEAPKAPWDWTQNAGFALIVVSVICLLLGVRALTWGGPRIPAPIPQPHLEPEIRA